MKKITLPAVAVLSLVSTFTSTLSADDSFTLFSNTKYNGEIRARYENVDDKNNAVQQANAYTLRATLGLETTLLGVDGLSMKVDGTTVQTLGGTKYNDLSPTKFSNYDVVADPEQTRFTQGYVQYKMGTTTLKAGRQISNLDNQRFIGSVDWRQMPQSLDALSLTNTSIAGLSLYGAYVYSYATVFDEPTQDSDSVLLNAAYKINEMLKVTAYDYMLSLEKGQFSADTYGVVLSGDVLSAGAKIGYRAEYAKQGDSTFDTTTTNIQGQNDASYYDLEATASMMGVSLGTGYEFLSGTTGSDGKTKFQTPLATLHKFNGTADKFLATPTGGLCDTSVSLGYGAAGLGNATITYHDFETDVAMSGKSDLGSEWDIQYANAIPGVKGLNGLIKAAYYDGGDVVTYSKDVTKVWLQVGYKF
ncbi:MAG: hypothetical protein V2A75_02750 [Pseudomonadota bacterium]